MSLDVSTPDPPSLHGPQPRGPYESIGNPVADPDDDYRREEIKTILANGAWNDAFEEWANQTSLSEANFEVAAEQHLFDEFDFYWDAITDEVGYRAPTLPQAVRTGLETGAADDIDSELDTLGRVVSEMLENDYLLRDEESYGFFDDDLADNTYESRNGN